MLRLRREERERFLFGACDSLPGSRLPAEMQVCGERKPAVREHYFHFPVEGQFHSGGPDPLQGARELCVVPRGCTWQIRRPFPVLSGTVVLTPGTMRAALLELFVCTCSQGNSFKYGNNEHPISYHSVRGYSRGSQSAIANLHIYAVSLIMYYAALIPIICVRLFSRTERKD